MQMYGKYIDSSNMNALCRGPNKESKMTISRSRRFDADPLALMVQELYLPNDEEQLCSSTTCVRMNLKWKTQVKSDPESVLWIV